MPTYVVTAMFNSRAEAERAVQRLVRELRAECAVVGDDDDKALSGSGDGIPVVLGDLLISDEDRRLLAEGLRRGCVVVTAAAVDGDTDRAAALLDDAWALDLDAQQAIWGSIGGAD